MITLTREEAQQVLDALIYTQTAGIKLANVSDAVETLRARLAEPEKEQEPVAWISAEETWLVPKLVISDKPKEGYKPVYTAPPQREFVGLTDEEIEHLYEQHHNQYGKCESVGFGYERAIEAKLKEKNGGN